MKTIWDAWQELAKKRDAEGWPKCKKCGVEFLRVKVNGLCGDCDPPKLAKPTVVRKETLRDKIRRSVDPQQLAAGENDDDRND